MPFGKPESFLLALVLLPLAAQLSLAQTVVAQGDGGYTVTIDDKYKTFCPLRDTKIQNKSTADSAAKYLSDMEAAAQKGDKTTYDHAVNNLKALVEINAQ